MKLNDPFGRLQQKQQNQYESLRATLREAGIDSADEARRYMSNMRTNTLVVAGLVLGVTLLVALFFPQYLAISLVFGIVILLWLASVMFNGYRFIKRYIDEELSGLERGES